jgi:hypothetical protein
MIASVRRTSIFALEMLACSSSQNARCASLRWPKTSACVWLRCRTVPSGASVAAIWQRPPSTRGAPNVASSRSRCDMPFNTGSTFVPAAIAGAIAAIASSRSNALQLSSTTS